jgi:transposase
MKKNWIIGIDVAGNGIHYQIQNAQGLPISDGPAAKSMDGYLSFTQACKQAGVIWKNCLIVIEATGRHHLPWCERLVDEGASVYALNPLLTKRLYSSRNAIRDNKDDRLDAHSLSEIGRMHGDELERFAYTSQSSKIGLQTLASTRKAIRNQCTNLLKSGGDLLALVFPELKEVKLGLTHVGFRRLLLHAPTPAKLAALPECELKRVVGTKSKRLRELAQNCFTPEPITQACEDSLLRLIEAIEDLSRHLKNIDHTIEKTLREDASLADRHTVELIRSNPGFGEITTPILVAFLPAGFEQWGTKKQIVAKLQAYFGFDPRRRELGSFKGKVKISKRGIGIVRTALFQASFCSMSHDPKLRQYYDKKKAEGDHHKKVIIDLMRKNLKRVVAVLINQKEFQNLDEKAA